MSPSLSELLQRTAARHSHLCPRQVLGTRMGLAGLAALGLEPPLTKLTGMVIVETDGCFVDGIEVSTGATVGHRTLRVNDLGKLAATFVHVQTTRALRLSPQSDIRSRACSYGQGPEDRYARQLIGYQAMPEKELFSIQEVILDPALEVLLSRPDVRVNCSCCGEEIINERARCIDGKTLCRHCAGEGYYVVRSHLTERRHTAIHTVS